MADELEVHILQRYIKSARMSVLTCLESPLRTGIHDDPQPHLMAFGKVKRVEQLIGDTSVDQNVLASSYATLFMLDK